MQLLQLALRLLHVWMLVGIALFKAHEFHLLRNNLISDFLHNSVIRNIICSAPHLLFRKFRFGRIKLCLCGLLLHLGLADRLVKDSQLFNRRLDLFIGAVNLMLFAEARQLLLRLF